MSVEPHQRSIQARVALAVILLTIFILWCWMLEHAILTRTASDFLRYATYIAIPVSLIYLSGLVFLFSLAWRRTSTPEKTFFRLMLPMPASLLIGLMAFATIAVAACITGATFYAFAASVSDFSDWLQSPSLTRTQATAVGVSATLLLGLILFWFRLNFRTCFGITETMVGLTVAGQMVVRSGSTASDPGSVALDPAFYLAVLTAGVYIVVRGFDNIHQGFTKEPLDPAMIWIYGYIQKAISNRSKKSHADKDSAEPETG